MGFTETQLGDKEAEIANLREVLRCVLNDNNFLNDGRDIIAKERDRLKKATENIVEHAIRDNGGGKMSYEEIILILEDALGIKHPEPAAAQ